MRKRTVLIVIFICLLVSYIYKVQTGDSLFITELFSVNVPEGVSEDLLTAVEENNIERVKDLMHYDVDPNIRNDLKHTALMVAANKGQKEVATMLLDKGAKIDAQNDMGNTALILASGEGHYEIVQLLVSKGADVNTASVGGHTALMIASIQGHLDIVRVLLANGAEVNATTSNGWSALMMGVESCQVEVVGLLMMHGADPTQRTDSWATPLSRARWKAPVNYSGYHKIIDAMTE